MEDVRVQSDPFDAAMEAAAFAVRAGALDAGAVVTFSGLVRGGTGPKLLRLEIEHYPGMTERAIHAMRDEARERWQLSAAMVIHRYGSLAPGEPIMMVATAARHRAEAFSAAEFLMDYLKSRAPFWKKEVTEEGANWVAARDADEAALDRWRGA
ncbi:MAG: molybdenum cofactor biosynthesis protein MoaE [Rhodobacteraceae bacterium]|nr:molybdenum cofactor biosynthesis protein MoaE [Paracoccaceae bacterium]